MLGEYSVAQVALATKTMKTNLVKHTGDSNSLHDLLSAGNQAHSVLPADLQHSLSANTSLQSMVTAANSFINAVFTFVL